MTGHRDYTEVLNQRLKHAGRELVRGLSDQGTRVEAAKHTLEAVCREAGDTKTFFPWLEAVGKLSVSPDEQLVLCALWADRAAGGEGIQLSVIRCILSELTEEETPGADELPHWIFVDGGQASLSPVLYGWLESRLPELPEGAELLLPKPAFSYGLESILKDAGRIFHAAEETGEITALCITGEPGSGRTFCMEQICAKQNMGLILIDGDQFRGTVRELNACVLCARLYEAFPCVHLGREVRERLLKEIESCFLCYGIIRDERRVLEEQPEAIVYTRKIPRPDRSLKLRAAKEILGDMAEKLPEHMNIKQLTGRQLPIGLFLRYLKNIRAELRLGSSEKEELWVPSVSTHLQLLPANRTFEELKLPRAQHDQLRQISRMAAAREEVMEQWGFGKKFSYGNGISILFYGAPGTGKTMAAQVMAHELGMPLYRVDLSQLISKYIGETQKNIGRIFDEADKCDCILLFDEADAIFTRRSDVSDAQDRYSNAETAYLLQRIEQYAGVSILATNLLQNFDDAFRRRISYMVHFPMPDVNLRRELWDTIFPDSTPVSPEVDSLMLAQAFELSGASIKNAALHGALMAKAEGNEVGMRHILSGIRNEYGKQGKSLNSSQQELMDAFS